LAGQNSPVAEYIALSETRSNRQQGTIQEQRGDAAGIHRASGGKGLNTVASI
jgi:hypothetical protein